MPCPGFQTSGADYFPGSVSIVFSIGLASASFRICRA